MVKELKKVYMYIYTIDDGWIDKQIYVYGWMGG